MFWPSKDVGNEHFGFRTNFQQYRQFTAYPIKRDKTGQNLGSGYSTFEGRKDRGGGRGDQ